MTRLLFPLLLLLLFFTSFLYPPLSFASFLFPRFFPPLLLSVCPVPDFFFTLFQRPSYNLLPLALLDSRVRFYLKWKNSCFMALDPGRNWPITQTHRLVKHPFKVQNFLFSFSTFYSLLFFFLFMLCVTSFPSSYFSVFSRLLLLFFFICFYFSFVGPQPSYQFSYSGFKSLL